MLTMARRVRAMLFVAVAWGLAWAVAGLLVGLTFSVGGWDPLHLSRSAGGLRSAVRLGSGMATVGLTLGALTGLTFTGVLRWMERRRPVDALAGRRLMAWGALAGVLWQLVWLAATQPWEVAGPRGQSVRVVFLGTAALTALLGACSGWATLRLAQRGRAHAAYPGGPGRPAADACSAVGAGAGEWTASPRESAREPVA